MSAKGKIQKQRKKSVDSFAFFKQAATNIFEFLITDLEQAPCRCLEWQPSKSHIKAIREILR